MRSLLAASLLTALSALVLVSCTETAPPREPSAQVEPPLEQGERWTAREDEIQKQIVEETKRIAAENQKPGGVLHRDAHPKHHGCVKAFWTTEGSELAPADRRGVFVEQTRPLPAWLRLSNGDSKGFEAADSVKDVRGFALKIMGAQDTPLGSQDFIAITSERFFSRDGEDYLNLFHALRSGKLSLALYAARNWTNISLVRKAQVQVDNMLTTDFFTPVPLKYGPQSMRMHFAPCANSEARALKAETSHPNYLREILVESLKKAPACFDVLVQINRDPAKNAIENPTLAWDPVVSPWKKVGRVTIPVQDGFDTPARQAFCENLSYNPWNAHHELRPMGQINRMRKAVYEEVSKLRHDKNGVPQVEPRDHDACVGETEKICRP